MGTGEQAASSIYQEITDVELDGLMGNEQVIIERSTNPEDVSYTSFTIQRFDPGIRDWRTEYTWTIGELAEAGVENGFWNVTGGPVVILKAIQAGGERFSYRIIGYSSGKLGELVVREGLYDGNVFFYGCGIIEQRNGQYAIWTVIDGELALIPY